MKQTQINIWALASVLAGIAAVALIVIPGRENLINPALFACAAAVILGIVALTKGKKGSVKQNGTWLAIVGIALPILAIVVLSMLMATATKMP